MDPRERRSWRRPGLFIVGVILVALVFGLAAWGLLHRRHDIDGDNDRRHGHHETHANHDRGDDDDDDDDDEDGKSCSLCDGDGPSLKLTVDYAIAGAGVAGLRAAADWSQALRDAHQTFTMAVFEKNANAGGNYRATTVTAPAGYDNSYGPLRADLGAQRTNQLTLTEQRRAYAYYNITNFCTPFRNIVNCRGRREIGRTPQDQATNYWPYYDSGPDPSDAFSYSDFPTYKSTYTDPVTGAFRNTRTGVNVATCCNSGAGGCYPNTDSNICDNQNNNDPSYDAYQYVLQGEDAPAFDAAITGNTGAYAFNFCSGSYPAPHPLTGVPPLADMSNAPRTRAGSYVDIRSYYAGELSTHPTRQTYNDDYANFLTCDNVGFTGDHNQGFGARSYINYQAREWNTAAHSCYPQGGVTALTDAMKSHAIRNGVQFYLGEPVVCIKRSRKAGIKYELRTTKRTVYVRKFLVLAIPTPTLENRTLMDGDVLRSLDTKREFHRARAQIVASVIMQWPPGKEAWFWQYFDKPTGNYSARQYGDTACFSRIELVDTPWHRCHNTIRAVYSDFRCRAMFEDLIAKAKATGNWIPLRDRVLTDLITGFPEAAANITNPILTLGEMIDPAWYWGKPEYDDISNEAHAIWAATPLGPGEPLFLASESVHIYYQGWGEGALRSVRQGFTTRLSGSVLTALNALYAARDAIAPGDGTWNSNNFRTIPAVAGFKTFRNEVWWPYSYASTPATGYCKASNVGRTNYPTTPFAIEDDNAFGC